MAVAAPLVWTFPAFSMWRMQPDEFRFHESPPLPWRWAKPLFAPSEDPKEGPPYHMDEILRSIREDTNRMLADINKAMSGLSAEDPDDEEEEP